MESFFFCPFLADKIHRQPTVPSPKPVPILGLHHSVTHLITCSDGLTWSESHGFMVALACKKCRSGLALSLARFRVAGTLLEVMAQATGSGLLMIQARP